MFIDFRLQLDDDRHAEMESVLERIEWDPEPDRLVVVRSLAGGRSGADVLEVEAVHGDQRSSRVVKLGPSDELVREHAAYKRVLRNPTALFAPIVAGTPGVDDPARTGDGEREAIVYDYASGFLGVAGAPPRTLEDAVRTALDGGRPVDDLVDALSQLFEGIDTVLYARRRIVGKTSLDALNRRIGIDATLVVDRHAGRQRLALGEPRKGQLEAARRYKRAILKASRTCEGGPADGEHAYIRGLTATWHGERLIGELGEARVAIVAEGERPLREIAAEIADGAQFEVYGRVQWTRARRCRDALLEADAELGMRAGALEGPGARVADPFLLLDQLLAEGRERVVAPAHGDLNPRNVLLVPGRQPILIDYAHTAEDEPLFLDFARLEGSLVRDALPDLGWARHVRLQRLLATAARLGDGAASRVAETLGDDEPAFRLLWAVRRAARAAYPADKIDLPWWRDHLTHLLFYAHLSLKWTESSPAAMRAAAAMAGVATEVLDDKENPYRHWGEEELSATAPAILATLRELEPASALSELAALTTTLDQRQLDDPEALETVRAHCARGLPRASLPDQAGGKTRIYIDVRTALSAHARRSWLSRFTEQWFGRRSLVARTLGVQPPAPGERWVIEPGEDAQQVIEQHDVLVLLGKAGAGKSTVIDKHARRLVDELRSPSHDGPRARLPVIVRAPSIAQQLDERDADGRRSAAEALLAALKATWPAEALTVGAVHVAVDALNELDAAPRESVIAWIKAFRLQFPRTPIVVCHRSGMEAGLLPFATAILAPVTDEQARDYIYAYLGPKRELAERLLARLAEREYSKVRALTQRPLFLWMIADLTQATGKPPTSHGRLFHEFSQRLLADPRRSGRPDSDRFDQKSRFLEAIADALVQRGATDLEEDLLEDPEFPGLEDGWRQVLRETVADGMLDRSQGKLRFQHESFQEYFAARRFLPIATATPSAVRERVLDLRSYAMLEMLVGFAGEQTDVARQVIESALEVDPRLAARCLRHVEHPQAGLVERLTATQGAMLSDPGAGLYERRQAAEALALYGREAAWTVLGDIAGDPRAPTESRAEAVARLGALLAGLGPGSERAEAADAVIPTLAAILDAPAAPELRRAVVAVAGGSSLRQLGLHIARLVAPSSSWPEARAAFAALDELGFAVPSDIRSTYRRLCRDQLDTTERELFDASSKPEIEEHQSDRVEILDTIAEPAQLAILLERRFSFGIAEEVAGILEHVAGMDGPVPPELQAAWDVLHEPEDVDGWFARLAGDDDSVAIAAAHRILAGEHSDDERLARLLDSDVPPARLRILAELLRGTPGAEARHHAERRAVALLETTAGASATEGLAALVAALEAHTASAPIPLSVVAHSIFRTRRRAERRPEHFPWVAVGEYGDVWLDDGAFEAGLEAGGDQARAAVYLLSSYGGYILLRAAELSPQALSDAARERFVELAQLEDDPFWLNRYARAAAEVHAVELLPWLGDLLGSSELAETVAEEPDVQWGVYEEPLIGDVLRATGLLARVVRDQGGQAAAKAVTTLMEHDARTDVAAAHATALAYLGDWRPVFEALGPERPWLHEAASNAVERWLVDPGDAEGVVRWIAERLRDDPSPPPEVRSTLRSVQDHLEETRLRRHVER